MDAKPRGVLLQRGSGGTGKLADTHTRGVANAWRCSECPIQCAQRSEWGIHRIDVLRKSSKREREKMKKVISILLVQVAALLGIGGVAAATAGAEGDQHFCLACP